MQDLTKTHIDAYPKHGGIINLRDADSGWSIGVLGGVEKKPDPLVRVQVRGTYADGTPVDEVYEVPQSVLRAGEPVAIMDYLLERYGVRTS